MARTVSGLGRSLRDALTAALAITPSMTMNCGGSVGPGLEDDPDFVAQRCTDGQIDWLADIEPAESVDYAELRVPSAVNLGAPVSRRGKPCAGAQDIEACEAKLALLVNSTGFRLGFGGQIPAIEYLAFTRGDEVGAVIDQSGMLQFLGDINTPGEAMLVAALEGFEVPCDGGGATVENGGFLVQGYHYPGCDGETRFLLSVSTEGVVERVKKEVIHEPEPNCSVGRRPFGLVRRAGARSASKLGSYFACAAELEAASVPAFRRLLRELTYYEAPSSLRCAAARAVRDEVSHARLVVRLARRFGARPLIPEVLPIPVRSPEAIAMENAVEGCVRETMGAAIAAFQASRATDSKIRRTYRTIARDEARHAALGWAVASWLEPRLSLTARSRVAEARTNAAAALGAEFSSDPDVQLQRTAGLPTSKEALAMVGQFRRTLWS